MKTKPYNRHETFLAALSDSSITVPTPLSREELYLAKIAGESVTIPAAPYNRYETYLAKMAGQNVAVPTPASRIEFYMYKACGYRQDVPVPANREEILWLRYAGYDSSETIVSINDAANEPVRRAEVRVNCRQSGSGDPSPDNIRPITGRTSLTICRTGKNLWGGEQMMADIKNRISSATEDTTAHTITYKSNATSSGGFTYGMFKASTVYTLILNYSNNTISDPSGKKYARPNIAFWYADSTSSDFMGTGYTANIAKTSVFKSSTKNKTAIIKSNQNGTVTFHTDLCGLFEGSVTEKDFEAYNGEKHTIDISGAGTVYGGTLDVTNGILTVTHDMIASYNGEPLPGEWISDRDVYTVGGVPTIGAQVVYELDVPEVYQIAPTEMSTISGVNNIWSNAGPVSVTYIPDL